jgi:hypothetical protein
MLVAKYQCLLSQLGHKMLSSLKEEGQFMLVVFQLLRKSTASNLH